MNTSGNTVLLTGGSSGIGLALAKALLAKGNTVIAVSRNAEKLAAAVEECPDLHTSQADISNEQDRLHLVETLKTEFPSLNILFNNAAAAHFVDLQADRDACDVARLEMETNYLAPMRLTALLLEQLNQQPTAAIVNISTIGVFLPLAAMPGYSASKAALHSYTQSLRRQLGGSAVKVFEVIPPAVDTDLVATFRMPKVTPELVAEKTLRGLENDDPEIFIGAARALNWFSRLAPNFAAKKSHELTAKALDDA